MKPRVTGKGSKKSVSNPGKRFVAVVAKLKRICLVALPVIAAAGGGYLLYNTVPAAFRVKTVEITGNEHLNDDELKQLSGLRGKGNLLTISGSRIYEKLKESPWIQTASVRKEYPSKLLIRITETEPFALLDMRGKMFVVDDRGRMLEQLRENTVPFLPVISGDPYREKEAFREAVDLAKAIKTMGMLHQAQRIEIIAHKPNELAVDLDGLFVKVGAGEHEDKLARLLETEEEIKKRNIAVAHIDLRFAKKVVVKPVHEVIK